MKRLILFICVLNLFGCKKSDNTPEIIADFGISVEYATDYSNAKVSVWDASLNVPDDKEIYYEWKSAFINSNVSSM